MSNTFLGCPTPSSLEVEEPSGARAPGIITSRQPCMTKRSQARSSAILCILDLAWLQPVTINTETPLIKPEQYLDVVITHTRKHNSRRQASRTSSDNRCGHRRVFRSTIFRHLDSFASSKPANSGCHEMIFEPPTQVSAPSHRHCNAVTITGLPNTAILAFHKNPTVIHASINRSHQLSALPSWS